MEGKELRLAREKMSHVAATSIEIDLKKKILLASSDCSEACFDNSSPLLAFINQTYR